MTGAHHASERTGGRLVGDGAAVPVAAPVVIFDSNRDALARRLLALGPLVGARPVIATSSRTAAVVIAELSPPATLFLVDLFATDFVSLDRPGERLIRRLARCPRTEHVRLVAWSAQGTPDVIESVRGAGAEAFVTVADGADTERQQLTEALKGECPWPASPNLTVSTAAWEGWFRQNYDLPWAPWVEPTLVRLASGRDRTAAATELHTLAAASTLSQATHRLRVVAEAIAGEHRNSPAIVAAAAALALAQIAAHRPLVERLDPSISLDHGARMLRSSPSVQSAAGLTDHEAELVLRVEAMIRAERVRNPAGRGAPKGDIVFEERHWAAGQLARDRGAAPGSVDTVIEGVLVELGEALQALDDVRQDELYHPESRAAAALAALPLQAADRIDDVRKSEAGLTWRGQNARELTLDTSWPVSDLREFVAAADRWLAALAERRGR